MRRTLQAAVTGLLLIGLAACGGSGSRVGDGTADVATQPACADGSSGPCIDDAGSGEATPTQPRSCGGMTGEKCPDGYTCVDIGGDGCDPANGAADCAGTCEPNSQPVCTDDADCPALKAACGVCADGSSACPKAVCDNGQCAVVMPTCPEPKTCGGIAGATCAAGYVCVDVPNDGCDPATGADCAGMCVPEKQPGFCGGIAGVACPDGYECVDDPGDDCDPKNGGADCPGICQPIANPMCESDKDCPAVGAPCSLCADGTAACPSSTCVNAQCTVTMPACPEPKTCGGTGGLVCPPGYVCSHACDPATGVDCSGVCVPEQQPGFCGGIAGFPCPDGFTCVDDPSDGCDPKKGGADCGGICQPIAGRSCATDTDCPALGIMCSVCPDGTAACPSSTCVNGQCTAVVPVCPQPKTCGGIAGLPCPDGYECVDDPGDDCDPNNGGADCIGSCVPAPPKPESCGGFTGQVCADGFECVDDPSDSCDPANGGADCPGICQPAMSRACKTDADCPVIGAPCKLCPDGTAACPRSVCTNGQCGAVFDTCAPPA